MSDNVTSQECGTFTAQLRLPSGEREDRFHTSCVSAAECSSFLQLQAAASKVSARFLPFSPRLPEINFAESLAKMSGWFLGGRGGGGGKELAATSFHPSFFSSLFSHSWSCSRSPALLSFCLETPFLLFRKVCILCWLEEANHK